MKKILLNILIIFAGLASAQPDYKLIISGSPEEAFLNAVYSPDGTKIAYTKNGYQGLWVYDTQTQNSYQLTDEVAAGFGYKWSSDSKSILTRVAKYENQKRFNAVKIFNVDTKSSQQLTDYKVMMPYLPDWIAGDSKVYLPTKGSDEVFVSGKEKQRNIYKNIIAFEKNNKIVLKNLNDYSEKSFEIIKDARYLNISVSPDQSKLVFEVMGGNMFVIDVNGTGLVDLGKGDNPEWSNDNTKIVYTITKDNGHDLTASDIYIINADGSSKRNLSNTDDLLEMNPSFSPDDKSIIFDISNDGSIYLMNFE
jgi:Tol biopolymer transport system component